MYGYGLGYGAGFVSLVWWVLVIVLVAVAVRYVRRDGREEPLRILKRRYASGEITKQEFEERRKDLA